MNKTVLEMAKEAGLFTHKEVQPELQAFAELVRADAIAAEREACAKVCDEVDKESQSQWPKRLATMIRARGNT